LEHEDLKLDLPKQIMQISERLSQYGYSAYICGECVRLLIAGQTPFDYSVMTDAEFPRIRAIFETEYNILNQSRETSKLEATEIGDEVVVSVLGVAVGICSFADSDLKTQLQMKQAFTFNAIAYSMKSGFNDFWNGLEALDKNEIVFIEDGDALNPYDILPALVMYSDGEFTISESAQGLIMKHYIGITTGGSEEVSQAALREEFEAILMGRNVRDVLIEYSEIFTTLIPELKMLEMTEIIKSNPEVALQDLRGHTYRAVGVSSPNLSLRYALLFRELGKPDCYALDPRDSRGIKCTFYGQVERACIYAKRIMTRMGCDEDVIAVTISIIENAPHAEKAEKSNLLDLRDEFTADLLKLLLKFNVAVCRSHNDGSLEKEATKYYKLIAFIY
jgi:tRNA nucleotidyltransferase (CCA-adding enzyme)